jgi:lipid II isoglutaminyl synthase (glutamine-hydrolysing)
MAEHLAGRLTVVHVYPELLGTYGDRGNALALLHRAEARGIATRLVEVGIDEPLPRLGDIYVLGGGEDSAQLLAARALFADDRAASVLADAPCFAVCAGLQLLSRSFLDGDGRSTSGLGLLDVDCERLADRAVGEIVTEPVALGGMPTLTGYENHRGTARLGPDARPLGRLVAGVGNGDERTEGAQQGSVLATYLHGPALVRNPALADLLLSRALGPLPDYVDDSVEILRAERLEAADPRQHRARRALLRH